MNFDNFIITFMYSIGSMKISCFGEWVSPFVLRTWGIVLCVFVLKCGYVYMICNGVFFRYWWCTGILIDWVQ